MAKTGLYQTEKEMSPVGTLTTAKGESIITSLLNIAAFQNYISVLVTSCISHVSYDLVSPEERPAVIMDVTQNTWIKLLSSVNSSKVEITSPKGYVAFVARSESIDEIRRRKRKPTSPLPANQDGEVLQGKVLLTVHQEMSNPAIEYELKEFISEIADEVLKLPPKQMYAMICVLKDEIGHTFPLAEVFWAQGIDIESINWPQEAKELQRLRSSLSVARRTLREKFNRSACHSESLHRNQKEKKVGKPTSIVAPTSHSDHE